MACDTSTLANASPCLLIWNSGRSQLIKETILLAHAINAIDGSFTVDWPDISDDAQALVRCLNPGQARNKAAQLVQSNLSSATQSAIDCFSNGLIEQIKLYLTCRLITAISP